MKLICTICFIILYSIVFSADFDEVGLPIITNYNQDVYDAHNQNWDIIQSNEQLIYVANGNGLLEFDGENWVKYDTPNRSRIREIEWVDGKIYVGTLNDLGYFAKDDKGMMGYHSLKAFIDSKYLPFGEVWSLASDADKVVFKTSDYYFVWDGESMRTIADESHSRVKLISVDNELYVKLIGKEAVFKLDLVHEKILSKTTWLLPKKAQIKAIKKDENNHLIIFTGKNGVFKQQAGRLQQVAVNFKQGTYVYDVLKANDGLFYVATVNEGLYILSKDLKTLKNYHDFHGFEMNAMTAVMQDVQNNIWIVGNKAISVMRSPFEISQYAKSENAYSFNLRLMNNTLSYMGKGLFQLQENSVNSLYPPEFKKVQGLEHDIWNSLDYQGKSFIAINGGVDLIHLKDSQLISQETIFKQDLFAYDVVATDDFKQLFVATSAGLFNLQKRLNSWQVKQVKGFDSEVNNLVIENNEILWVGNNSAQLLRIELDNFDVNNPKFTQFDKSDGIGNNKVVPFNLSMNLSMGMVFATNDGVMQYSETGDKPLHFMQDMPEIFSTKDQDAHVLYEDSEKRLWYRIGTHSGFAFQQNGSWSVNEQVFDYFPDRATDAFVSSEKDVLWFLQADDGVFRMDVSKTQNIPALAPLYVRKVQDLNSKEVIRSGVVTELTNDLSFESNSLRIHFAMAAFAIPNKAMYRSKLNGLVQAQWSEWSNENYRDFTELRSNDYVLEVQAQDGFGRTTASTVLKFRVLPPWYLSVIALSLYALFGLLILIFTAWLVQNWRTKKLQAHNIELTALVDEKTIEIQGHVEQLEQQQELKTRFFTNISHELRTPLSLIILPLQKFIKSNQKHLNSESQNLLTLSLKNANGMKKLVNQVLDVSRFEQKSMPIVAQKNEWVGFVENIAQQFNDWASENQQQITLIVPDEKIELYFDRQMMEKIISNVLSNAIKYSGKNTQVIISFITDEKNVAVLIKDNGVGIAKDQCSKVFERYFKGDENSHDSDSSGIGLAFVKEMVELHQGEISLISDTGLGCEFRISFKRGHKHFSNLEFHSEQQPENNIHQSHPDDTAVILLVEDNTDLRQFVCQSLSQHYRVIQAINGVDALKTLTHELPDLIISDIMMPQMDGIEFLQKLREQAQFKTVPFFLLSSKSNQEDTQMGLQYGANDYITKPFDMDELLLRVKNMINSRKLIRQQVKQQLQEIKQKSTLELSSFVKKMRGIIIDNLADSHFNVNGLSEKLCIERSTLFRQVKKQLNISPSQYIQHVRLEIAQNLLLQNQLSVSEVAYASGFESLSYFSKLFKTKFGQSPSVLVR